MKRTTILATVFGSAILLGAQAANAACVFPAGFPPNDVSLDGFGFEVASAPPPPIGYEVDMNGIQRGFDEALWATHGTFVALLDVDDRELVWVASWTKNTFKQTEEWVCRLKLVDPPATLSGEGAVHILTPGATPAATTERFQCRMDLVADCS